MSVKMGLKESKKWAIGSVHENGGGKFEILDRWYDEESDSIMLKYRYENGKVETNKEANVNSSEWKWRKVRGLTGSQEEENQHHAEDYTHWEEYWEGMYIRMEKLSDENSRLIKELTISQAEQTMLIREVVSVLKYQGGQLDQLVRENGIINKLLEKL